MNSYTLERELVRFGWKLRHEGLGRRKMQGFCLSRWVIAFSQMGCRRNRCGGENHEFPFRCVHFKACVNATCKEMTSRQVDIQV